MSDEEQFSDSKDRVATEVFCVTMGVGRLPTSRKNTRAASAVRVFFRVCGHKGIACKQQMNMPVTIKMIIDILYKRSVNIL